MNMSSAVEGQPRVTVGRPVDRRLMILLSRLTGRSAQPAATHAPSGCLKELWEQILSAIKCDSISLWSRYTMKFLLYRFILACDQHEALYILELSEGKLYQCIECFLQLMAVTLWLEETKRLSAQDETFYDTYYQVRLA
ncbi:hypothetical protein RRG08_046899 [Elysia crispata]|uniref:Uncharacterized protein n=1 Tax=Elysia crispata TaxID=231223 RepID=A0AAE0ZI12_9GAST|nr:hypothetical protein RRG08_046899 [Elysia crispata]